MIRRLRAREEPSVVVQIEDGLIIAIPCWMLDEPHCRTMPVEERPRLNIDGLVQLRKLIDRQTGITGAQDAKSASMMAKAYRHEPLGKDPTPGADSASTDT